MSNSTSKSSLFLMELIMSIMFFSLASAICVQLFVKSHSLSHHSLMLNNAVISVESTADALCSVNGDPYELCRIIPRSYFNKDSETLKIYYDSDFKPIDINDFSYSGRYILSGHIKKENDLIKIDLDYSDYKASESVYTVSLTVYPKTEASNEED